MKKLLAFIALILSVAMLLSFVGCENKKNSKDPSESDDGELFGTGEITCEAVAGKWSATVDARDALAEPLNKAFGSKYEGYFADLDFTLPITVELEADGEYVIYMDDEDDKYKEAYKTSVKKAFKEFYLDYAEDFGISIDEALEESGYDTVDEMIAASVEEDDSLTETYRKRAEGTYTIEGETLRLSDKEDKNGDVILVCDRERGMLVMDATEEQKKEAEEKDETSNLLISIYPIELKKAK